LPQQRRFYQTSSGKELFGKEPMGEAKKVDKIKEPIIGKEEAISEE